MADDMKDVTHALALLDQEPLDEANESLLQRARTDYEEGIDSDRTNRDLALEDLEFLAGTQWPSDIVIQRREDDRPMLTINRLPQYVDQVTGDIRQNSPAINVRPADDQADDDKADIYKGLIRQIEYACDASLAYHTAAEAAAACGMGHFRIKTDYTSTDSFLQDIKIERITNQFGVTWDPFACDQIKRDANYCFVEQKVKTEVFKATWPDASLADWQFNNESVRYVGDWVTADHVRVAEYWRREKIDGEIALLSDNRVIDITDLKKGGDGSTWIDEAGEPLPIVRTRKVKKYVVKMWVINGGEVLDGPFDFPVPFIPIIPVVGHEIFIGERVIRHGVVRFAKDPQRMYNYWRTAQTEQMALQPKAPFLVTATNIEGYQKYWREANRRNLPYLPYKADPINKGKPPLRSPPPAASPGMYQEIALAAEDMKGTTGMYDASVGAPSKEISGRALRERKDSSNTTNFNYPDNLARSIRHAGTILVHLIPKIYNTQRVIRILNEDATTKRVSINQVIRNAASGAFETINDLTLGKYDVAITTGPSFSTKREEASDWMQGMATAMPDKAALFLDLLVEALDLPFSDEIAKRLRKALPPGLVEPRDGEEAPEPSPPTPEQINEGKEIARKALESAAKSRKLQAETDKIELENTSAALMLDATDGDIQDLVTTMVNTIVAEILGRQGKPQPGQGNGQDNAATMPPGPGQGGGAPQEQGNPFMQ